MSVSNRLKVAKKTSLAASVIVAALPDGEVADGELADGELADGAAHIGELTAADG
ncbi:MAG: hypothetical protein ACLP52_31355 [Streptosporangiaceae bacterium]